MSAPSSQRPRISPAWLCSAALTSLLLASLPSPARQSSPEHRVDHPPHIAEPKLRGIVNLEVPSPSMVLIPEGSFIMGSTPEAVLEAFSVCRREPWGHRCRPTLFGDETPEQNVHLPAYFYDTHEVTVAEYQRCVDARRCRPVAYAAGATRFDRPRFPVSLVTWEDARRYCAFRNARLPSEAEFERAARGQRGRRYPWGDLYNSHASNHGRFGWDPTDAGDGYAELAPVGSFPAGATPEGIFDLAGNVAEWVADRYSAVYAPTASPPRSSAGTGGRVIRGGSYESAAPWLRGAVRRELPPEARAPAFGFRCARSLRTQTSSDEADD